MAGTQDEDMYLFQGGLDQTPGAFAGQDFDNFLESSPGDALDQSTVDGFLNPNDLTIKREHNDSGFEFAGGPTRSSRNSASSGSSSGSAGYTAQNISSSSTVSPSASQHNQAWGSGINGLSMPSTEQYYDDTTMSGLGDDLDASNQQMASAFDFETAASTPSGYDAASMVTMKAGSAQPFRRTVNMANFVQNKPSSSRLTGANQAQFYMGSREASPLSAMLPQNQAPSPWTKHSPSSGLEETFNHITMNGDSPGNATFSPNMQFGNSGFTFDPESSSTPSTYNKDISSPPSTINSGDGTTHFTIYPTSLKSRVETQIPIKMVIFPLPPGVKKLRLPTHTVSKPKFLAKPEVDRSPEVLELYTSLVCTSAMQDPMRLDRALARARGEELPAYSRPSPASSTGSQTSSKDDEEKPLNGGEVKICSGCIQRERKRASRKKQKKPEEEELFQKDEERRVVVFNTSEIKDWVEVTKDTPQQGEQIPASPPGAMQVELPMRIACYCRHQNEKMGFQVIFTVKDYKDKVIAQALTNSIMITDDHKTHNAPATVQTSQMPQMPTGPQLPGAGVFSTSAMDMHNGPGNNGKLFKQSFSTTDLQNLQHNFNPHFPMSPTSNPFAISGPMSAATSGTMTPRNLSRPASPSGPGGPNSKRRKQSGSGKLPSGLTMTRLDTAPTPMSGSATMPNTAASSPYATNMASFMSPAERFPSNNNRTQNYGTSPPTPNGNDQMYSMSAHRTFSLENIPRQALISAPSSRQPSRPSSPRPSHSNRNSFGATDANFGQAVNSGLMNQPMRRAIPIIHKLVPAEGSVTGGTEVTLLGNGFYQGLEVMFGDTEATTTTFWGEKCLNCIAPPALQAGVVAVVFKHEHPQYSTMQQQSQPRHSVFTYVDDREVEILRLALRTLGKTMQHPTDDPYSAARQLLQQNQNQGMWPQSGNYGMGGSHQRQPSNMMSQQMELLRLESNLLDMLKLAAQQNRKSLYLNLHRPSGLTLLHLAASLGMTRFVNELLKSGANPNQPDNCGHTAMHHAAMYGHDQIILSLSSAGGDHRIRSLKNFLPMDFATSLSAYQAALRSHHHKRSHSAGSQITNNHICGGSSASLQAFWKQEPGVSDDSDYSSDSDDAGSQGASPSFRDPGKHVISSNGSRQLSRRNSGQHPGQLPPDQPDSSGPLLQAWRQLLNLTHLQQQQLADQIQHFQETAQWAMPQLPTLPQDNPVVRRMSALFPNRPSINLRGDINNQRGDEWDPLKRSSLSPSAPPAYEELYPGSPSDLNTFEIKKSSAVQAAADAAADLHFESKEQSSSTSHGTDSITESGSRSVVQRVDLMKDRKLFFIWIPILAIVLGLMFHNSGILQFVPSLVKGVGNIHNQAREGVSVV